MKLSEFFIGFEPKSDKNTSHSYIDGYYCNEFSNKKEDKIRLLEVGVREGFSHILWDKYFTNGEIYGVDNGESGFNWEKVLNESRVKIFKEDAYSEKFTNKFEKGYFDYIIEDGSHHPTHQKMSIGLYLPLLKSGGKLIIEDIGNTELANSLETEAYKNELTKFCKIVDLRGKKNRWDDLLLEITKK